MSAVGLFGIGRDRIEELRANHEEQLLLTQGRDGALRQNLESLRNKVARSVIGPQGDMALVFLGIGRCRGWIGWAQIASPLTKGFKGFNKIAAIGNAAPANLWVIPALSTSPMLRPWFTKAWQCVVVLRCPSVRNQRSHRRASFTDGN